MTEQLFECPFEIINCEPDMVHSVSYIIMCAERRIEWVPVDFLLLTVFSSFLSALMPRFSTMRGG